LYNFKYTIHSLAIGPFRAPSVVRGKKRALAGAGEEGGQQILVKEKRRLSCDLYRQLEKRGRPPMYE
jgi:hypothetical protein